MCSARLSKAAYLAGREHLRGRLDDRAGIEGRIKGGQEGCGQLHSHHAVQNLQLDTYKASLRTAFVRLRRQLCD